MIEEFEQPFDVALALHACGNATDLAMLQAQRQGAAYAVSPCCVGGWVGVTGLVILQAQRQGATYAVSPAACVCVWW